MPTQAAGGGAGGRRRAVEAWKTYGTHALAVAAALGWGAVGLCLWDRRRQQSPRRQSPVKA